jgi:hypothetical protein
MLDAAEWRLRTIRRIQELLEAEPLGLDTLYTREEVGRILGWTQEHLQHSIQMRYFRASPGGEGSDWRASLACLVDHIGLEKYQTLLDTNRKPPTE